MCINNGWYNVGEYVLTKSRAKEQQKGNETEKELVDERKCGKEP